MITFGFVGLETITGLVLAGLLIFLNVEKTIGKKQQQIREFHKAECLAKGQEWIDPEELAKEEQRKFEEESEEIYLKELKEKCDKKGWNYEEKLKEHLDKVESTKVKNAQKRLASEAKEAQKVQKIEQKKKEKIAKMTPEKLAKYNEKIARRHDLEEKNWEKEKAYGEAYRAKIQSELTLER